MKISQYRAELNRYLENPRLVFVFFMIVVISLFGFLASNNPLSPAAIVVSLTNYLALLLLAYDFVDKLIAEIRAIV